MAPNVTYKGAQKCYVMNGVGSCADAALLCEGERPIPEDPYPIGPEVLIRVKAAALNPIDAKLCAGLIPAYATPPLVPGKDFAGVVVVAGCGNAWEDDDEVYGDVGNVSLKNVIGGSLSEYILVDGNHIARKPKACSWAEAASLSLVGQTVWDVHAASGLAEGQTVVVLGASGGVGTFGVQYLRAKGLTVIGVCSAKNAKLVSDLGASKTIDYAAGPWTAAVDGKVDGVFDFAPSGPHNAGYWAEACDVMKPGGVFVTISGEDPRGAFSIPSFLKAKLVALWRNWRSGFKYTFVLKKPATHKLREITAMVDAGQIKPVVDHVFPWAEAHAAFRRLESGRAVGKVVVLPPNADE